MPCGLIPSETPHIFGTTQISSVLSIPIFSFHFKARGREHLCIQPTSVTPSHHQRDCPTLRSSAFTQKPFLFANCFSLPLFLRSNPSFPAPPNRSLLRRSVPQSPNHPVTNLLPRCSPSTSHSDVSEAESPPRPRNPSHSTQHPRFNPFPAQLHPARPSKLSAPNPFRSLPYSQSLSSAYFPSNSKA
jgi:hypothetical protein